MRKPDITSGKYNCVSLFSGILGLDLGLHEAGFATKVALDFDKHCAQVVAHNFPELPFLQGDIRKVTGQELLANGNLTPGEVDLLAGGPPCQPFSKSGLRKGLKDERGNLFRHYIRLLDEIKPRAFVLENVRGMVSSNKGNDFRKVLEHFKDTGYAVYWRVLDAANYGVPQFRQRVFVVGFRDRLKFTFPDETRAEATGQTTLDKGKLPLVSTREALAGLREPGYYPEYNGKYSKLLKEIPEGLNYSYFCEERGHERPLFAWRSKFWYFLLKADGSRPSLTIQAYPGNNTGPFHWENRRFGINELKRIQTLPDWFEFNVAYFPAHKLIGNAVPPSLASKIGHAIADAFKKNKRLTEAEYHSLFELRNDGNVVKSWRGSGKGRFGISNGRVVRAIARHAAKPTIHSEFAPGESALAKFMESSRAP